MTKYSGSPRATLESTTSMYILNERPVLSAEHHFTVHRGSNSNMVVLKPGEFYQWSFFLHAGSRYKVNSCVWEGNEAEFFVIRGKNKFDEWIRVGTASHDSYSLKLCNSTAKQYDDMWNNVTEDDKYYFVYSSLSANDQLTHVWVNMSFTKLEYSINETDAVCHCNTNESMYPEYYGCQSCGLQLSFSGFVIITTMPRDEDTINWEDKIYVTWSCDGSYNAYLLVFCLPLMVVFIGVLLFSDLPKLCANRKSSGNVTHNTIQPVSPRCNKLLIVLLLFLCALLCSMGSVCLILLVLSLFLKVISYISGGIPALTNKDLKLGLLASAAILFVISTLCNKFREWMQKKVVLLCQRMKMLHPWTTQTRRSDQASNASSATVSDANPTPKRADKARIMIQLFRLIYLSYIVPLFFISVVSASAIFSFLEGFYPVLVTYGSETDSDIFTPGDTRVFSFNSFFCSQYSISSYGSQHLSANLHVINPESIMENHSISYISSNESICTDVNVTWNFYLSDDSFASIKACLYDSEQYAVVDVYTYDVSLDYLDHIHSYPILNDCSTPDLVPFPIKEQSVGQAGKYLIWLNTDMIECVNVHVDIQLNRSEYFINRGNNSMHTCSIGSHNQDTCAASAPTIAGSMTGLISVHSDQPTIDWHETISITKTCKYHWATWTAIWLPVIVINIAVFMTVFGLIQRAVYKQLLKKYAEKVQTEETEPLLNNSSNSANVYGTNDVTTNSHGAPNDLENPPAVPGDAEPAAVVVAVDVEHNPNDAVSEHSVEVEHTCSPTSVTLAPNSSPVHTGDANNDVKNNGEDVPTY